MNLKGSADSSPIIFGFDPRRNIIPPRARISPYACAWFDMPDGMVVEAAVRALHHITSDLHAQVVICMESSHTTFVRVRQWLKRQEFFERCGLPEDSITFAPRKLFAKKCQDMRLTHFAGSITEELSSLSDINRCFISQDETRPVPQSLKVKRWENIPTFFSESIREISIPKSDMSVTFELPQHAAKTAHYDSRNDPHASIRDKVQSLLATHSWVAYELYKLCIDQSYKTFGKAFAIIKSFGLIKVWHPSEEVVDVVMDEIERRRGMDIANEYTWVAKNPTGE